MKMPLVRPLLAAILAGALAGGSVSPLYAQQAGGSNSASKTSQSAVPVSLGVSKYDFTKAPKAFPTIFAPYKSQYVDPADLINSPRLEQLIHDGKLPLTLQDAIALAMENSMDIVVQRYYPWIADAGILKAKAGEAGYGIPGANYVSTGAFLPQLFYDPVLTEFISYDSRVTPINNPFLSGTTGRSNSDQVVGLASHTAQYNTSYQQAFDTGTSFNVAWNNTRASSSATANAFNPYVQPSLTVGIQQQLLQGFGRSINRRNLLIAQNNRKIADLAFTAQAITTVTNVVNAYWELAYARENVGVQQQAVTVAEKLYNDNKKQLEIGTMAPLDVTRAESELATDRQNLIVAQTTQLQDELVLKNYITKNPLDSNLLNVELVPVDKPEIMLEMATPKFDEAVKIAFDKRPDLQEQYLNLKNADIDVKATKNALLPTATLGAQYGSFGLAGNAPILGDTTYLNPSLVPILDANGNPVKNPATGLPIFVGSPNTPITGYTKTGFGTAQSQIFQGRFPDYAVSLTVSVPLRNRSAQADSIHSQLARRQLEAQMQQLKNSALLQVRNATIALEQDRAQVAAARQARELQKQTFEAEQKKYQLGASTVYNVILTQRDYIAAQATELRALANFAEAKANYEQSVGTALESNSITVAGAEKGVIEHETLIPGTVNGKVIGTDAILRSLSDGTTPAKK